MSLWPLPGRDPEPLQRPRLAGVLAATGSALPCAALVWVTGAAAPPAQAIGVSPPVIMLLSIVELAVSGAIYGSVFLRAANDRRGGWLFGLGWGFLTWALGPITLSQWILERPISSGPPAALLLAAHLIWGLALGLALPAIQRRIEQTIEDVPPPHEQGLRRRNPDQAPQRYRRTSADGG